MPRPGTAYDTKPVKSTWHPYNLLPQDPPYSLADSLAAAIQCPTDLVTKIITGRTLQPVTCIFHLLHGLTTDFPIGLSLHNYHMHS